MITTWIRGRVVTIRAFPSFVTRPIAPFSAIPKLAPEIPMSARRNFSRSSLRAAWTMKAMSGGISSLSSFEKYSATWKRLRWMAGITMWEGLWPARATIHSPRSVSVDGDPGGLQVGVQVDLLAGHRFRFDDPLDALFLAEVDEVGLEVVAGLRPEDLHAPLRRLRLEAVGHLLDPRDGVDLHLPDRLAEGLDVAGVLVGLGPGDRDRPPRSAPGRRGGSHPSAFRRFPSGGFSLRFPSGVTSLRLLIDGDDREAARAVDADGQDPLDVGGPAGAGDEADIAAVEGLGDDLKGLRDAGDDVGAGEKDDVERRKDRDQAGRDVVAVLKDASRLGDPELHPRDADVGGIRMGGDLGRLRYRRSTPRERSASVMPAASWRGLSTTTAFLGLDGVDEPDEGFPGLCRRGNTEHFAGHGLGPHLEFGEEMRPRFLGRESAVSRSHLWLFMIDCLRNRRRKEAEASMKKHVSLDCESVARNTRSV